MAETVVSGALAELLTNIMCPSSKNNVSNDFNTSAILNEDSRLCYKCKTSLNELYKGLDCEFGSCIDHLKCMTTEEQRDEGSNNETILVICAFCQKNFCY